MKSRRKRKSIAFLISHQPNPRFVKQIKYLSQENDIAVIHFFRKNMKDFSETYKSSSIKNYRLSIIPNELTSKISFLKRLAKYFSSIIKLKNILKENSFDIIIMNNIDMFLMLRIASLNNFKNYIKCLEISDLLPIHEKNNFFHKVFFQIERYAFKNLDKLIVTSPLFYKNYYNNLFKKDVFVLENKPLKSMLPLKLSKRNNKKKVIGIVGLLLQLDVYKNLFNFIKNNRDYEVHIYGMGRFTQDIKLFASKASNIKYFGPYNFFEDIAKIYSSIDIIYMPYSSKIQSLNNKLALPNKFYEAMYFQVPIVTSKNTYLGERVENLGLGKVVNYEEKIDLSNSIDYLFDNYDVFIKNFKSLNSDLYFADKDYLNLELFLTKDVKML